MDGSSIKSTFRDYVRVIFQRKKFIIIPVIGIPLCIAIYAFVIADEVYRADNCVVVLDNKTNKPLLGNLSTTSDLGKRIDTSVKRITSRSGMINLIASIDYVSAQFPDSAIVQNKRMEILTDKRVILEYRLGRVNKRIAGLKVQMENTPGDYEKRRLAMSLEDLGRDKNICEEQIAELQKKIRRAEERMGAIAGQEAEFQRLLKRSERQPENEELRLLCQAGRSRDLDQRMRLDEMVERFLKGLRVSIHGNSVSASFESRNPQLCKDVVDEALLRLESENLAIKKREVLSTAEILDEKILEYEQRVEEKGSALKGYQSLHILDASPGELASEEFNDILVRESTATRFDVSAPYIVAQYRDYKKEHADIRQKVKELTAERGSLDGQLKATPEFINGSVIESMPEHVARLKDELHAAEIERAKLLETMTDKHPHVKKVTAKIERLKGMLDNSNELEVTHVERVKNPRYDEIQSRLGRMDSELAGLKTREEEAAKNTEYYRRRALRLPDLVAEHSKLARELLQDRRRLQDLLERKSGAEITRALEVDSEEGMRFEKPDPTALPLSPIRPNRRLLVLLGLLLGGAGAAVLLFFVEYADRSIRGIADVKRHLGLPVLGAIPHFFKKDKGVKVRKTFSVRGALNCALVTVLVTVLAISFFLDEETSDFLDKQLGRETPAAGYCKHQCFPGMFSNWRATMPFGDETQAESTDAAAPDAPEIDIAPGVFAAEEGP